MADNEEKPKLNLSDDDIKRFEPLSQAEREVKLKEMNLLFSSYDTTCSVCGRHCDVRCTADGDWQRCHVTRFESCSVCGHASNQHYAAPSS